VVQGVKVEEAKHVDSGRVGRLEKRGEAVAADNLHNFGRVGSCDSPLLTTHSNSHPKFQDLAQIHRKQHKNQGLQPFSSEL
jgi:hypothetical protein